VDGKFDDKLCDRCGHAYDQRKYQLEFSLQLFFVFVQSVSGMFVLDAEESSRKGCRGAKLVIFGALCECEAD
jgi:hypothetical protein